MNFFSLIFLLNYNLYFCTSVIWISLFLYFVFLYFCHFVFLYLCNLYFCIYVICISVFKYFIFFLYFWKLYIYFFLFFIFFLDLSYRYWLMLLARTQGIDCFRGIDNNLWYWQGLMKYTWTHGIDRDSWYRHGVMV